MYMINVNFIISKVKLPMKMNTAYCMIRHVYGINVKPMISQTLAI